VHLSTSHYTECLAHAHIQIHIQAISTTLKNTSTHTHTHTRISEHIRKMLNILHSCTYLYKRFFTSRRTYTDTNTHRHIYTQPYTFMGTYTITYSGIHNFIITAEIKQNKYKRLDMYAQTNYNKFK